MSSLFELVCGLALSAAAVFVVLRPIFSPPLRVVESNTDEGDDPEDDFSARAVALRALKEIEFDRATGKLADSDYDSLKEKYTAEALAALRNEASEAPDIGSRAAASPQAAVRTSGDAGACPTHGTRPEPGAQFCSACGRRLSDARSYCMRCGTPLESNARFCSSCGRRVAA